MLASLNPPLPKTTFPQDKRAGQMDVENSSVRITGLLCGGGVHCRGQAVFLAF